MQFDPNSPIWLQVMTAIKTDIAAGRIKPGDKLPGGRELAVTYSINPNTAARVYQELEKEGVRKLVYKGPDENHKKFLDKMGYQKKGDAYEKTF